MVKSPDEVGNALLGRELKEGDVEKPCHDSGQGSLTWQLAGTRWDTPCLSSSCTNQRVKKSEVADKGKNRYSRM
jgi:hypothetical protein